MKRVKFMLAAITMIAAVGGTLAFKASKIEFQKAFTCNAQNVCQLVPGVDNVTTTVAGPQSIQLTRSYTITPENVAGKPCSNLTAPCTKLPSTYITAEF